MAFASINQASVGGGSSNALSIQSDGIFMPRLSTGQRTALALTTSDAGLTVYDFTLNNLFIWNGTAWESIPGSGDAGANGSVQYNDNGIVSGASNFTYNKATGAVSIAGDLTVDTSTLFVDSTNNVVGIGTTTPNSYAFNDPAKLVIANTAAAGSGNTFTIASGSTGFGQIAFANGTSGTDRFNGYIKYSHVTNAMEFYANAGALQATLNSTGNLVLAGGNAAANGVGVTFPAVAVPSSNANCLDDYEEGTWTGTLDGGTTNPTIPVTATGQYTKIGNQVFARILFSNIITTGASGAITVTGLPFANGSNRTIGSTLCDLIATFTGSPICWVGGTGTTLNFQSSNSNGAASDLTHNAGTGRYFYSTIVYTV